LQASIDDYLTVYPNLNASVKDVKDKEGNVTVATAKMLTANKGKSRLGASVSIKFFASKAAKPSGSLRTAGLFLRVQSPARQQLSG